MMLATEGVVSNNSIVVQDGGWKYQVDLDKEKCTCGEFNCRHLKIAYDLRRFKGTEFRYLLLSSMHKEVRRSDVQRAFHFAQLLTGIYGERFVSHYIRRILFEETRNTGMLNYLGRNWQADITCLASSVKKWELPNRDGHVVRKAKAYISAVEKPQIHLDMGTVWKMDNYYEALAEMFRIRRVDDKKKTLRKSLIGELTRLAPENPLVKNLTSGERKNLSFYDVMAALEFHYKVTGDVMDAYHQAPTPVEKEDYIEFPEDYAHDLHTRQGASAIHKFWKNIRPNEKLPAGLDLRWTGSILGVLWRERAYVQFGDEYRSVPWDKVHISDEEWRLAKVYDSFFYKRVYRSLEPQVMLH